MRKLLFTLFVIALMALGGRADAQLAAQQTFIPQASVTGTNTISFAVPNVTALQNLVGVPIRFIPANTSSSAVTIAACSGCTATALKKMSNGGLVALSNGELVAGQATEVVYDGTEFVLWPQIGQFVNAGTLANSALTFSPVNLQLNAAVSANALTISLCTINSGSNTCNNPSTANPVLIPFRDATIANGDPTVVSVTAALSFTIASGSTMGCRNGVMCRLWIFAVNNSGTAALCAYNANSGGNSIIGLNEATLVTGASGTSGGSSAQTPYCTTASLTNVPLRYIGFVDIQESTAGTWSTGPTYVQLFGPGIKKPGEVVQEIYVNTTSTTSCNSATFTVETAVNAAITPTSAANLIETTSDLAYSAGTASSGAGGGTTGYSGGQYQLSRGTGPTLIGPIVGWESALTNGSSSVIPIQALSSSHLQVLDAPNTTSSTTYAIYCKYSSANTFAQGGGSIIIKEIMGAIEPVNDNGLPLRRVG